jgi:uncharacterized protein YegP (UPF0339 family)
MFEITENEIDGSYCFQMIQDGEVLLTSTKFTDARSAKKVMEETAALQARGGLGFKVVPTNGGYYLLLMALGHSEIARSSKYAQKTKCIELAQGILAKITKENSIRIIAG